MFALGFDEQWLNTTWISILLGSVVPPLLVLVVRYAGKVSDEPIPFHPTGKALLLVDGCNGPLRLDKDILNRVFETSSNCQYALSRNLISFLNVENGQNHGERIALVPALEGFVRAHSSVFAQVNIYFDGLGVFSKNDNDAHTGKDVDLRPGVQLKITPLRDEADGIMIDVTADRTAQAESKTNVKRVADLKSIKSELVPVDHESSQGKVPECQVYTFHRDGSGPGKSRQVAKPLCLLRAQSVFCLFGCAPIQSNRKNLQRLMNAKLSFASVESTSLCAMEDQMDTVVATDDIFLRQRIVSAGGYVMTFEQLWDMLHPFSKQ